MNTLLDLHAALLVQSDRTSSRRQTATEHLYKCGTFQVYFFKSAQNLAYFFKLNISTNLQRGAGRAKPPPHKYAPVKSHVIDPERLPHICPVGQMCWRFLIRNFIRINTSVYSTLLLFVCRDDDIGHAHCTAPPSNVTTTTTPYSSLQFPSLFAYLGRFDPAVTFHKTQ